MIDIDFDQLYEAARCVVNPRRLSASSEAGGVGAAILTELDHIYRGVCVDTPCSMGFCAEHAAAAAMITAGENRVIAMVAVNWEGTIYPPCGRCREFIRQLHDDNIQAKVMIAPETIVTLEQLLPHGFTRAENE